MSCKVRPVRVVAGLALATRELRRLTTSSLVMGVSAVAVRVHKVQVAVAVEWVPSGSQTVAVALGQILILFGLQQLAPVIVDISVAVVPGTLVRAVLVVGVTLQRQVTRTLVVAVVVAAPLVMVVLV
jgi:hypothetical protein